MKNERILLDDEKRIGEGKRKLVLLLEITVGFAALSIVIFYYLLISGGSGISDGLYYALLLNSILFVPLFIILIMSYVYLNILHKKKDSWLAKRQSLSESYVLGINVYRLFSLVIWRCLVESKTIFIIGFVCVSDGSLYLCRHREVNETYKNKIIEYINFLNNSKNKKILLYEVESDKLCAVQTMELRYMTYFLVFISIVIVAIFVFDKLSIILLIELVCGMLGALFVVSFMVGFWKHKQLVNILNDQVFSGKIR